MAVLLLLLVAYLWATSSRSVTRCPLAGLAAGQRQGRKDVPVEVVVDVEVARETRYRCARARPRCRRAAARRGTRGRVRTRGRHRARASCSVSIAHAVCDGVLVPTPANDSSTYEWHVSPQPPSGFCTRAHPVRGVAHHVVAGVQRDQRADHAPGAVDVVHAPAAVPRAPGTLLARADTPAPAGCRGRRGRIADRREHLDARARSRPRTAGRAWRRSRRRAACTRARACCPCRTHAHAPLRERIARHQRTASATGRATPRPRSAALEQGEHDDGGVVDVRDRCRCRTRTPSRRNSSQRHLDLPVAAAADLLGEQPVDGAPQRRMVARDAGLAQREHRPRGVPHRRHARLETPSVLVVDARTCGIPRGRAASPGGRATCPRG